MFNEGDKVEITFPSGQTMEATISIRDTEAYAVFAAYGVWASISLTAHPQIKTKLLRERSSNNTESMS